jgi:hypothetical protein
VRLAQRIGGRARRVRVLPTTAIVSIARQVGLRLTGPHLQIPPAVEIKLLCLRLDGE